jgi:hypothetical protein
MNCNSVHLDSADIAALIGEAREEAAGGSGDADDDADTTDGSGSVGIGTTAGGSGDDANAADLRAMRAATALESRSYVRAFSRIERRLIAAYVDTAGASFWNVAAVVARRDMLCIVGDDDDNDVATRERIKKEMAKARRGGNDNDDDDDGGGAAELAALDGRRDTERERGHFTDAGCPYTDAPNDLVSFY